MHDVQHAARRSFAQADIQRARKACFAIALALGLSACGGGGAGDPADPAAPSTNAVPAATAPATSPTSTASESDLSTGPETSDPILSEALPVASDRAPLGVNIEGLWDWARLQPFADVMKSSRPWGTVDAPWDEGAAVDARDGSGLVMLTSMTEGGL